MKHICIGHAPLLFTPNVPFEFISPEPIEGTESTVIADDALGADYDGRVLSEYLQLMVLADRWRGLTEMIHLFQYRRFLTPLSPAPHHTKINGGIAVSAGEALAYLPDASRLEAVQIITIGTILKMPMAAQYGRHHFATDLLNFARSMQQSGAFSTGEIRSFLTSRLFLPSSSVGIYPADVLVRHLDMMRHVWQHFRATYYVPRHGYQRRVGGYLMERLQGYLLLRHFDDHRSDRVNVWYRCMLPKAAPMQ